MALPFRRATAPARRACITCLDVVEVALTAFESTKGFRFGLQVCCVRGPHHFLMLASRPCTSEGKMTTLPEFPAEVVSMRLCHEV